ncbi:MAG: rhomboid family intramembrane serine protease [Vallitaleaceae bacterium]|nr:rhomboid family intramembrane serine protease [Vallitaleaceae bacterium]
MSKDNKYIFELISSYFQARHFQQIPTDLPFVAMFATYQKSSLYLINIITLSDGYSFDHERYDHYKKKARKQFEHVQADKIIMLNTLIMGNPEALLEIVNHSPNLEEQFIDVHWIIDSKKRELIIPSRQMKSVLGLDKPIIALLNNEKPSYYDIQTMSKKAYLTFLIILINIGVWIFLEFRGGSEDLSTLLRYGALNVKRIEATGEYWRFLTAMFLHIGFTHLAYNTFSLYIFGARLEKYLTHFQFFVVYIGSGLIASLTSFYGSFLLESNIVAAGASGAVYGLIGSILLVSKAATRPIEGLNSTLIFIIFIMGIVYSGVSTNVDAFAHIGGFVGGLILTLPILWKRKRQVQGVKHEE